MLRLLFKKHKAVLFTLTIPIFRKTCLICTKTNTQIRKQTGKQWASRQIYPIWIFMQFIVRLLLQKIIPFQQGTNYENRIIRSKITRIFYYTRKVQVGYLFRRIITDVLLNWFLWDFHCQLGNWYEKKYYYFFLNFD